MFEQRLHKTKVKEQGSVSRHDLPFLAIDLIFQIWSKTLPASIDYGLVSSQVSDSLSSQLKWSPSELDWFVYADNTTTDETSVRCVVWILSRNELNETMGANESAILVETKRKLIDSFDTGLLKVGITVDSQSLVATGLSTCVDFECQNVADSYTYPYTSGALSGKRRVGSLSFLIAFCVMAIVGKIDV